MILEISNLFCMYNLCTASTACLTEVNSNEAATGEAVEVKPEENPEFSANVVPVHSFLRVNARALSGLFEMTQTYKYGDMEISFSRFPMPFRSTTSDLIKREGDVLSGNIPFNQFVSICYNFLS